MFLKRIFYKSYLLPLLVIGFFSTSAQCSEKTVTSILNSYVADIEHNQIRFSLWSGLNDTDTACPNGEIVATYNKALHSLLLAPEPGNFLTITYSESVSGSPCTLVSVQLSHQ